MLSSMLSSSSRVGRSCQSQRSLLPFPGLSRKRTSDVASFGALAEFPEHNTQHTHTNFAQPSQNSRRQQSSPLLYTAIVVESGHPSQQHQLEALAFLQLCPSLSCNVPVWWYQRPSSIRNHHHANETLTDSGTQSSGSHQIGFR